ncbi:TPA: hypothetical protein N0F65_004718 [Lagenidium giganteum]|uniref:Nudix hydrolase domain-containing protein n=1 Tax=Lagenidium giganteum TaxID=4803 RepID=A0AAV2Z638_9STRA|nr:TPA: hypothetical protein N0F65_004718 [Lagenidium giganteum]
MRKFSLPHRATYIVIKNSSGKFYVQRRTMIKDYCPGFLDPMAGGVVQFGESMEDNAHREAEEEMGVKGVPLTHITDFWYEDERTAVWGGMYECTYDGQLTLQVEEVDEVLVMSADEILQRAAEFTPDGIFAFRKYLDTIKQQQQQQQGA